MCLSLCCCLFACIGTGTCSMTYTLSPVSTHHNPARLAGTDATLIQNFFGSTGTANASFTAAVSASSPWCMQRCSSSDCGDAGLDSSIVLSSICDERLGQMWYNQSGTIRSRLNDECITICGISTAEAHASKGNTSLAASCLGKGSDYYNIETSACSGTPNQLWKWAPTPAGSVLFNQETSQAIKVCSDLEPWCGFLLLLTFDASWSARRLTAVRLPTNLSEVTAFQTFNAAVPTKAQASVFPTIHSWIHPPRICQSGSGPIWGFSVVSASLSYARLDLMFRASVTNSIGVDKCWMSCASIAQQTNLACQAFTCISVMSSPPTSFHPTLAMRAAEAVGSWCYV